MNTVTQHGDAIRRGWMAPFGLALAMGIACLPIGEWDHEFAGTGHLIGNEVIWWIYVATILWYVRKVERRPFSSIGLHKPGLGNIALGIGAGILITAVIGAMYFILLPALHLNDEVAGTANAQALMATPLWWRLISVVRAAVSEEIMFRGYAIERIEELSGSRTVAVAISCAVFTLAHVSAWGWSHELIVGCAALAFSLLYLWRRNLWLNMIAHFIVDAVSTLA